MLVSVLVQNCTHYFWDEYQLELEQSSDSQSNVFLNNWTKEQPKTTPKPNPLNPHPILRLFRISLSKVMSMK